jgi:hypothetical protein
MTEGDTTMLTKTTIALAVAAALGAASTALAADHEPTDSDLGGYRIYWQWSQARGAYNAYGFASPYRGGFFASPYQGRHLSREND